MDRRASRGNYDDQERRVRGAEVFVGGLPRSATEGNLREIFSPCGEIVELRIMKDQNGTSKGFGFVRFAEKKSAYVAKREKNGFQLQGKRIGVALSLDQDSLFFGNLCKEWSVEEFEELVHKTFKDVISVDLAMTSNVDSSTSKRRLNRGFAFVRFSSHAAAARALRAGSRADFLLGGVLRPAIDWAEQESNVDPDEMAKIKTAFVGNLPADVDDMYLKRLFEQFGEVERVAISRKGHTPVGFVHFASRAELDNAIKEMDGKTLRGPNHGPAFKIQVSVARPAAEKERKRPREEVKTTPASLSRDKPHYSYGSYGHDSLDRVVKAPKLSDEVTDITDRYEAAVISLPSAVKELLLRVLRLGIGTRYDIDIHCIRSLKELPESAAVGVLNQFLISGANKRDKGDYFASLIDKYQAEFGLARGEPQFMQGTYLPRNPELQNRRAPLQSVVDDHSVSRHSRYSSLSQYASSSHVDDPMASQSRVRRYAEERPTIVRYPEPRSPQEHRSSIGRYQEPRLIEELRPSTGRYPERRSQEQRSNIRRLDEASILYRERRLLPSAGYRTDIDHDFNPRSSAERPTEHPQIRFDPFTGEPYKFDPFTGEPIRPESVPRRSGSLY